MKNSIAQRIARRVLIMILIAMIILFVGAYHTVSNTISNESDTYANTVLGMYCDHIVQMSEKDQQPIDVEHNQEAIRYGDYICKNYGIDYVYLYVFNDDYESVTYICASFSENKAEINPGDHMAGRVVSGKIYDEERELWEGKRSTTRLNLDNSYGHEITTLKLIQDCNGNKIMAGVDVSYQSIVQQIMKNFLIIAIMICVALIFIGMFIHFVVKKRVSNPAKKISDMMHEYIQDGKQSDAKLEIDGSDEYAQIASAFNSMTDDIKFYIDNTKELTKEKANRKAELNIASGIQKGFLPASDCDYPDCNIHAMMMPAKDVGGDLYDYMSLGNGKYLTVIADVSGKGISAAMFMSVTLTLIRQFAKLGLQPNKILEKTNDALSENNTELLFVTAFVGIYDSKTKKYVYSNAGHNHPFILKNKIKSLEGGKGLLLGLYEGEKYTNATVTLSAGDTLFLYTDGVNEAVNPENQFLGDQRLKDLLMEYHPSNKGDLVHYIFNAIQEFSNNAEQHDDITMLALTVKDYVDIQTSTDVRDFEKIKVEILKLPISREQQLQLCLAAEEIFANICSYAYEAHPSKEDTIRFTLVLSDHMEMKFTDAGVAYNPLEEISIPDEEDMDLQIGGLGKFISTSLMDDAQYKYEDGKNQLTLIKYFKEETT